MENLSPAHFPGDKLNFTSSGLIKLFVSKIVRQPWGKGEFSPGLSIPPPSKLKPTGDEVAGSLPTALSTSPLADCKAFEFGVLWFRLLATLPLLQAQLKETYGPRFFNATKRAPLLQT